MYNLLLHGQNNLLAKKLADEAKKHKGNFVTAMVDRLLSSDTLHVHVQLQQHCSVMQC